MFGSNLSKIEKLATQKKSDQLAKFLDSKDMALRLAAIKGLGEAGGEPAFNNLTALLRNPDPAIRKAAAMALETLKDVKSAAFIAKQVQGETDAAAKAAMNKALSVLHEKT